MFCKIFIHYFHISNNNKYIVMLIIFLKQTITKDIFVLLLTPKHLIGSDIIP